jgi:hypothetical protein
LTVKGAIGKGEDASHFLKTCTELSSTLFLLIDEIY